MRIEDMTLEQLLALNEHICKRIDQLRARQDTEALQKLRLGQAVHFDAPEGRLFGTLIKINRKTVVIATEDGRQWKLPPGLVRSIREI